MKEEKRFYKMVRVTAGGRLVSSVFLLSSAHRRKWEVEYKVNEWVAPNVLPSMLWVRKLTPQQALAWHSMHGRADRRVYMCEVENPEPAGMWRWSVGGWEKFWRGLLNGFLEPGDNDFWADKVKLVRRIDQNE